MRVSATPIGSTKYFSNVPMLIGLWLYGFQRTVNSTKKEQPNDASRLSKDTLDQKVSGPQLFVIPCDERKIKTWEKGTGAK
jgi:hypothetical protein